jgi:hypothetical protein
MKDAQLIRHHAATTSLHKILRHLHSTQHAAHSSSWRHCTAAAVVHVFRLVRLVHIVLTSHGFSSSRKRRCQTRLLAAFPRRSRVSMEGREQSLLPQRLLGRLLCRKHGNIHPGGHFILGAPGKSHHVLQILLDTRIDSVGWWFPSGHRRRAANFIRCRSRPAFATVIHNGVLSALVL